MFNGCLGANVLLTCIAILAVDFRVFPRRFAKTETFGISLMDAGIGSFIVSSAITSHHARGLLPIKHNAQTSTAASPGSSPFWHRSIIQKCAQLVRCLPYQKLSVLCLGVGRMVALKALNYQEHVSEYGVHWNFFVTLYCVWTAADIVHSAVTNRRIIMLGAVGVLGIYEYCLVNSSLTEYMFSDVRDSLFSANKEGVVSLFGYIPMYLLTEELSYYLFFVKLSTKAAVSEQSGKTNDRPGDDDKRALGSPDSVGSPDSAVSGDYLLVGRVDTEESLRKGETLPAGGSAVDNCDTQSKLSSTVAEKSSVQTFDSSTKHHGIAWDWQLIHRLLCCTTVFWVVWAISAVAVQPTSRRLVNVPYVSLTLALAFSMVLSLYFVDTPTAGAPPVLTLSHMSKHSLAVFLGANLMTGAVNSSMQTIYASDFAAMAVLAVYCFLLTALAWGCEWLSGLRRSEGKGEKKESQ